MTATFVENPQQLIRELVETKRQESMLLAGDDPPWFLQIIPHLEPGYYFVDLMRESLLEGTRRAIAGHCVEPFLKLLDFAPKKCLALNSSFPPSSDNFRFRKPRPEAPKPSPRLTNIYVIQGENGGPVKIGRSSAPHDRASFLQCGNPYELRVVKCFSGVPSKLERQLHLRLQKYQVRNEWFSEEVLDLVEDLVRELMSAMGLHLPRSLRTSQYRDALKSLLRTCMEPADTLDGLRGQLEQIAVIAREALGQQSEGVQPTPSPEPPLITDEDLL